MCTHKVLVVAAGLCCALVTPVSAQPNTYVQTNLVSNLPELEPQILDPLLLDAWGIALRPPGAGGHFWVANAGSGTATTYIGDTPTTPLFQDDLRVVWIPSSVLYYEPFPDTVSQPTGQVYTGFSQTDFIIEEHGIKGPSKFVFVTLDGSVSAWTTGMTGAVNVYDDSLAGAMYSGVAVTPFESGNRLYIADFGLETFLVLDHEFKPVSVPGNFRDPQAPPTYTPWNMQYIDGMIYVTFARQGDDPGEEDHYPGYGRVASFDLDGNLVQSFEPRLELNAPWGMVVAPPTFGPLADALLVSNFADGTIVAFDRGTGKFIDYLRGPDGQPVAVDGLWGLTFGNGDTLGYANHLYFTAGPNGEEDGLFGKLAWKRSADLNGDGVRDLFDFLEFASLFQSGDAAADFDDDTVYTLFDFMAFVNAFNE